MEWLNYGTCIVHCICLCGDGEVVGKGMPCGKFMDKISETEVEVWFKVCVCL